MTRRIGVVGMGAISRYYLRAIAESPAWELAAVCDPDPARVHALDGVPGFPHHSAMLQEANLDAVVVSAPNDRHYPIARDCLDAGLAVCVEKPLTSDLAHARHLTALARRRGTLLFTAFHRRYNSAVRRLAHEAEQAGRIRSVRIRYLERIEDHAGPSTWYLDPRQCGGGCVADNGPNAFDLGRLLVGELEVTGARIARDAAGVDRRAVVDLAGSGAATVRVELDWSYPGEVKDIEVALDGGAVLGADMLAGHPAFKASLWHEYARLIADFAAAIPQPEGHSDGGRAAVALVEATYRAAGHSVPGGGILN